jgi:fermentation-respiration switch protein FrsA (DUF1100 family)
MHDTDPTTTYADTEKLYQAVPARHKVLWLAPLGGHGDAYAAQPEVYASRVLDFFKRYLVSLKDAPPTSNGTPPFPTHFSGH